MVLIYLTWVGGAKPVMWALIVALLLPVTLRAGKRSVEHLYRQEAEPAVDDAAATVPLPAGAVLLDRAVRFLLLVGGLWLLAWGWGIDYGALANQDDPCARFVRGALHAVVILLVADLLWKLASTAIDRRIALSGAADAHDPETVSDLAPEEERRRARLRTLLPILRIALFAVLAVMAVLMALSALGVQIGPLIAGAGVIGVAIGFGSQTLVRDIISGMFYLLDDAFRVGEYIVSGNFRGTVEGFSLRSIRLRHHRGPLFTVPFGNLGAVQNLSRDWVIDKITFNVPFDTDVAKVKKIVKQVSAEIMADPALAKGILEPLKSQGVYRHERLRHADPGQVQGQGPAGSSRSAAPPTTGSSGRWPRMASRSRSRRSMSPAARATRAPRRRSRQWPWRRYHPPPDLLRCSATTAHEKSMKRLLY